MAISLQRCLRGSATPRTVAQALDDACQKRMLRTVWNGIEESRRGSSIDSVLQDIGACQLLELRLGFLSK
jgi:hypothetical protein